MAERIRWVTVQNEIPAATLGCEGKASAFFIFNAADVIGDLGSMVTAILFACRR